MSNGTVLDPTIDSILAKFEGQIGADFAGYKNHCHRLMNFMALMGLEKTEYQEASILIPFHDLGIWTHNTMDYLPPSIELALKYCEQHQIEIEQERIVAFIAEHHKVSPTKGLPDKLRRADLIDLTGGLLTKGLSRQQVAAIKRAFPAHGFQQMIMGKVFRYAFTHPLRPFPMLKF